MKRHYDNGKGIESTETGRHSFQQNDAQHIPQTIEETNQKFFSLHSRNDGNRGEVHDKCQIIRCRATLVNIAKVGERPIYVVQHDKSNENEPLKVIPLDNKTGKCCVDIKTLNSILAGVNAKPKVVVLKRYKCRIDNGTTNKCGERVNRLEKDDKIFVSKQTDTASIKEERLSHNNTQTVGYHKMLISGQTDATSIKEERIDHITQTSGSLLTGQDELNSISQIIMPEEPLLVKEEPELDSSSPRESASREYYGQQIKVEPTNHHPPHHCPQERFFQRLNECLNSSGIFDALETDNQMDLSEQRSQPVNAHTTQHSVKHITNMACCKDGTHGELKAYDLCSRPIIIQKIINQVAAEPKKVVTDRGTQTRKKKKWRCCC